MDLIHRRLHYRNTGDIVTSLAGWWKCDEASSGAVTQLLDSSGNGLHGTPYGTPTYTAGKSGIGALTLNGSNQYVTVEDNSLLNFGTGVSFTISFWLKRADLVTHAGIALSKNGYIAGRYWVGYVDESNVYGKLYANMYRTTDYWSLFTTNLKDTNWHLVTIVFNKSTLVRQAYYDGSLVATATISDESYSGASKLFFGRLVSGEFPFHGSLDDIRIYRRALSQADVSMLTIV
jgi:hypothetical protein